MLKPLVMEYSVASSDASNNENKLNTAASTDDVEVEHLKVPAPDADIKKHELVIDKDYLAILQIKKQMEGKKKNAIGRRRSLPPLSIDWLFIRKPREYKLLVFVICLFILILSGLIVIYIFGEEELQYIFNGESFVVDEKTLDIEIFNAKKTPVLKGRLWRTRPNGRLPYDCSDGQNLCLVWKNFQKLHITRYSLNNATCHNVRWKSVDSTVRHMDCYQLDSAGHWFGAGLLSVQLWPLEKTSFNKQLFVTGTFHDRNSFGSIVERYWVTSSGVAIIAADKFPLHVSINSRPVDEYGFPTSNVTDHQFCMYAENTPVLNYTICVGENARHIHQEVAGSFVDHGQYTQVTASLLSQPVWSTWSLYKDKYNQSTLLKFAENIKSTGYNVDGGLLLIDDGWEERYGDMKFNEKKFQNPKEMIDELHSGGFQVSLWLHPQLNTDSVSFQQATANGFLVRDITGDVPGLTRWWNGPRTKHWSRGVAGLVDVSDANASQWQRDRIIAFRNKIGVDRLHIAGGETVSRPMRSKAFSNTFADPNDFTYHIAKLVSSLNREGELSVVQSAYRCQNLPVLVRITQGSSSWHDIGGLHSVISSALSLGLIGYPFFIPEAIGGSAFIEPPSKELYIRWLQVAVFFPIVHFSIPPENYDAETVMIARRMVSIHNDLVVPTILSLLNTSFDNLSPIVRPLWWLVPTEKHAFVTDTQFMVGDEIMVAPIVEQGARFRTIYLPSGEWQDQITGHVYTGPLSLLKYSVPLDQVPYFIYKQTK